ncbi:uncharacterized protein LOC135808901 isoform X2 [Sycon ciliatum]|uniref:uncharacterized protein LOC135808901 isoform X2 n=1 Tax=Sycon ciliatum TaxID=27933 RepID=UPI0031F66F42
MNWIGGARFRNHRESADKQKQKEYFSKKKSSSQWQATNRRKRQSDTATVADDGQRPFSLDLMYLDLVSRATSDKTVTSHGTIGEAPVTASVRHVNLDTPHSRNVSLSRTVYLQESPEQVPSKLTIADDCEAREPACKPNLPSFRAGQISREALGPARTVENRKRASPSTFREDCAGPVQGRSMSSGGDHQQPAYKKPYITTPSLAKRNPAERGHVANALAASRTLERQQSVAQQTQNHQFERMLCSYNPPVRLHTSQKSRFSPQPRRQVANASLSRNRYDKKMEGTLELSATSNNLREGELSLEAQSGTRNTMWHTFIQGGHQQPATLPPQLKLGDRADMNTATDELLEAAYVSASRHGSGQLERVHDTKLKSPKKRGSAAAELPQAHVFSEPRHSRKAQEALDEVLMACSGDLQDSSTHLEYDFDSATSSRLPSSQESIDSDGYEADHTLVTAEYLDNSSLSTGDSPPGLDNSDGKGSHKVCDGNYTTEGVDTNSNANPQNQQVKPETASAVVNSSPRQTLSGGERVEVLATDRQDVVRSAECSQSRSATSAVFDPRTRLSKERLQDASPGYHNKSSCVGRQVALTLSTSRPSTPLCKPALSNDTTNNSQGTNSHNTEIKCQPASNAQESQPKPDAKNALAMRYCTPPSGCSSTSRGMAHPVQVSTPALQVAGQHSTESCVGSDNVEHVNHRHADKPPSPTYTPGILASERMITQKSSCFPDKDQTLIAEVEPGCDEEVQKDLNERDKCVCTVPSTTDPTACNETSPISAGVEDLPEKTYCIDLRRQGSAPASISTHRPESSVCTASQATEISDNINSNSAIQVRTPSRIALPETSTAGQGDPGECAGENSETLPYNCDTPSHTSLVMINPHNTALSPLLSRVCPDSPPESPSPDTITITSTQHTIAVGTACSTIQRKGDVQQGRRREQSECQHCEKEIKRLKQQVDLQDQIICELLLKQRTSASTPYRVSPASV